MGPAAFYICIYSLYSLLSRLVPARLPLCPLCASLCSGSRIYLPQIALRCQPAGVIRRASLRFVSCQLINGNEWKELLLYLCVLMTLFMPPPL